MKLLSLCTVITSIASKNSNKKTSINHLEVQRTCHYWRRRLLILKPKVIILLDWCLLQEKYLINSKQVTKWVLGKSNFLIICHQNVKSLTFPQQAQNQNTFLTGQPRKRSHLRESVLQFLKDRIMSSDNTIITLAKLIKIFLDLKMT